VSSFDIHILLHILVTEIKKYLIPFFCFQMLSSKDLNFVGYTYKNFELVNEHEASGIGCFSISSTSVHYSMFIFVFTIY
jgi:hypothetical protein